MIDLLKTKKGIIWIIIGIVIINFLVLSKIELFSINIVELSTIFGALGTMFAAIIAAFTIWYQVYKYEEEIKPVLAPKVKSFKLLNLRTLTDWDKGNDIKGFKWSETELEIVNFGKMPIINIDYSFTLINYKEVKEELDSINNHISTAIPDGWEEQQKFYSNKEDYIELSNPEFHKDDKNILRTADIIGRVNQRSFNLHLKRTLMKSEAINVGEQASFNLPSYFIILNNHLLLKNSSLRSLKSLPELELYIRCVASNQKKWLIIYKIKYGYRSISRYGSKGNSNEFFLDFEFDRLVKLKK